MNSQTQKRAKPAKKSRPEASPTQERRKSQMRAEDLSPPISRVRLRSRKKLLDAALRVMGRKGVDKATIAEIAQEAGLGFGSFYNHFSSKEEIAQAVFSTQTENVAQQLERILRQTEDLALAISFVHRTMIARAIENPLWGWFTVHADYSLRQFNATFLDRARHDIQTGVDRGVLKPMDVDIAAAVTISGLNAIIREILEGKADMTAASHFTELMLRMYGIPADRAARLSVYPIPHFPGQDEETHVKQHRPSPGEVGAGPEPAASGRKKRSPA